MAIDLLMPSYTSRMKTNQRAGEMTLDAIPGLHFALSTSPENPADPPTLGAPT